MSDLHPAVERGFAWHEAVLRSETPACKWARLACARFERWLEAQDSADFPYVFDPARAAHMLDFIERFPHVRGRWAQSELLRLDGYQAFALMNLAGWIGVQDGLRLIRELYLEVARKNGKSTMLAPLGVYFLAADGEPGAEVLSAATTAEQAGHCFNAARAMLASAPELRLEYGLEVQSRKIALRADLAASMRTVATQTDAKDGANPHLAILDEVHQMPTREIYDAMKSGQGSRDQPLLAAITTAGHNTSGICYERHRYLCNILEGVVRNDAFFGLIFTIDEGDDPGDERAWLKANPAMCSESGAKSLKYMRGEWADAQANPGGMGEFLRKHLNVWTSIGETAFDLEAWRAAADETLRRADYRGRGGVIGVDLSLTDDLTSLAAVIPDGERFVIFARHFATQTQIEAPGNDHLAGWKREGRLIECPGSLIDFEQVMQVLRAEAAFFEPEEIAYDPHLASQMAQTLAAEGLRMVEMRHTPMNLDAPFNTALGLVRDGRIVSDGDPVLQWAISNTVAKPAGDLIRPAKAAPQDKIDPVSAMLTALARLAVEPEAPFRSVYEGRGAMVL